MLLVPPQPLDRVPYYLAASYLVVLPQRNIAESFGQMPAKLTDAMAMAKPVISRALSDIPRYLEGCGMVAPPDDVAALAEKILWVVERRIAAVEMGRLARERFLLMLTYRAIGAVVAPVIEGLLAGKRRCPSNRNA